jgi:hypothetical protein
MSFVCVLTFRIVRSFYPNHVRMVIRPTRGSVPGPINIDSTNHENSLEDEGCLIVTRHIARIRFTF